MTLSHVCNLLSSFALNAIFLTFSDNTLSASLLKICCDFNIVFPSNFVIFKFNFVFS